MRIALLYVSERLSLFVRVCLSYTVDKKPWQVRCARDIVSWNFPLFMWFFLKMGVGFNSQECLLAMQDFSYFSYFQVLS